MPRGNKSHTPEARAKISKTMTGRKLPQKHKDNIKKGHASGKETGAFYWTEEYKQKQSKPKKGCREAAFRQHYGRFYDEYMAEKEPDKKITEDKFIPSSNTPDWLKDYI